MITRKNFPLYTRVKVVKCKRAGETATILGKTHPIDGGDYIVLLDENVRIRDGYEMAAYTFAEYYLEQINDIEVKMVVNWTSENMEDVHFE